MAKNDEPVFGAQPPTVIGMPPELVALLLDKLGQPQLGGEQLAQILQATGLTTANAMQKALKPENAFHPGVSCYSYPEGDRDKPRPELKCEMSWVGCSIQSGSDGNMHWFELELLNQMEPGVYDVTKSDNSKTRLTVTGSQDVTGKLSRLDFTFPVRDGEKNNVAPMAVWLLEALGMTYMEAIQKHLQVQIDDQRAKTAPRLVAV